MSRAEEKINAINQEIKALEDLAENLRKRRADVRREEKDLETIAKDGKQLRDDITEGQVNYILGQSEGFVDGMKAALSIMSVCLAPVYDEDAREQIMYAFSDLGESIARARIKLEKDSLIARRAGWRDEWRGIRHWIKPTETASEEAKNDSTVHENDGDF